MVHFKKSGSFLSEEAAQCVEPGVLLLSRGSSRRVRRTASFFWGEQRTILQTRKPILVSYELVVGSCQFVVVSWQLVVGSQQLVVLSCQLVVVSWQSLVIRGQLLVVSYQWAEEKNRFYNCSLLYSYYLLVVSGQWFFQRHKSF